MRPFRVEDRVVRNPAAWLPNDFDAWGRGQGLGVVVEPVRWIVRPQRASGVDEPSKKMPLALAFEVAMVDAINIYVRTVLFARGHLSREGFDASGDRECIDAKYAVVREVAAKWAVFDGYDREPPAEQGPA